MKSNTNWNLYKTFVVVYETKNMSHAAQILGVSRVAVGQNIKELGYQLGVELFNSHKRGVEPTAAANNLYNSMKDIVDSIGQAESGLEVFKSAKKQTVEIAVSNTIVEIFLKEFLESFNKNHPDIRLEIFKRENMNLHKQKQLDLVIDFKNSITGAEFKTVDLFSVSDVFVSTKEYIEKHKIPHTLPLSDILRFPIMTRDFAWNLFCRENNLDPKKYPLAVSLPSYDLVHSVACNNPNGIVYYCRQLLKDDNLVVLNVADALYPPIDFVCGYTKSLSLAARTFINEYIAFVKSNYLS